MNVRSHDDGDGTRIIVRLGEPGSGERSLDKTEAKKLRDMLTTALGDHRSDSAAHERTASAHLRARVIELLEALDAIAPVTISELVSDYTGLGRSDRLLAAELALRVAVRSDNARLVHQLVRLGREYSAPVSWQDRVWQRIAAEPRPSLVRRLWCRLTGGRRW